jgi:chemotaxis protein MotA
MARKRLISLHFQERPSGSPYSVKRAFRPPIRPLSKREKMFAIIGVLVVFGAVIGGYLMEHGSLLVLVQPAELVIIGGAAGGTVLVANPPEVLKEIISGMLGVLKGSKYTSAMYMENLKMLFELFQAGRRQGIARLEADIEEPGKSAIFTKYPAFLADHHALHFLCDTVRMAVSGGPAPHELDQMMEAEMDVHHQVKNQPVAALSTMADSLPGLGIVAAVLGVVITMGALGGPPEEIGHKVAAALVGTFLGILLCYGLFGPIASNMGKINEAEGYYYNFLRIALVAFFKGVSPIIAIEFARRVIPAHLRPTFQEMETQCKQAAKAAAA